MYSSYLSAPANVSNASPSAAAAQSWSAELDDVALGCECADPSLQIACWGQEATQPGQAGGAAD